MGIACSWFCCIDGFHRCSGPSLSSDRRPWCVGVAKYMVKRCGPPSQGWCTFLRNHAPDIVAMDLFVVPSIGFDLLYALVIVRLARRDLIWINNHNPSDRGLDRTP